MPYNWSKPSIWHHFLFSLTVNNAVIISKVFEEKRVVQLANKANLWPQYAKCITCRLLDQHYSLTVSVTWLSCIIIIDWFIFFDVLNSKVFTFMLCALYQGLFLSHWCIFEWRHVLTGKTHQIHVNLFSRFLHICDVKAVSVKNQSEYTKWVRKKIANV